MTVPVSPKIYHIVHVDRLSSIIQSKGLWCDAEMIKHAGSGTKIGMEDIKSRRLNKCLLSSHPGLYVGACVPFYFCPRSIMLYLIYQANHPELSYRGGQSPIVHLEFDLYAVVNWAKANDQRWAFTLSNAGSFFFEDRNDLAQLNEINWTAIQSNKWSGQGISPSIKEGKQAELLIEEKLPWELVERIGVSNQNTYTQTANILTASIHQPQLDIKPDWYY